MSDYEDCELNNPNEGARNLCTHVVEYLVYGFNVRVWTAVLFTALFGLSACEPSLHSLPREIDVDEFEQLVTLFKPYSARDGLLCSL